MLSSRRKKKTKQQTKKQSFVTTRNACRLPVCSYGDDFVNYMFPVTVDAQADLPFLFAILKLQNLKAAIVLSRD